jgi:diadenosine tetraphosphate (Ap4A) HIT family hydrolase
MTKTLVHKRVEQARAGTNPYVVCRVKSGWVVLGDYQFLRGYSLLLPDPVVGDLNALSADARSQFLLDMVAVGDALLHVTGAYRINYCILGNLDPALHAHLHPRYMSEPEEKRKGPIWRYGSAFERTNPFDEERDRPLMGAMKAYLESKGVSVQPGLAADAEDGAAEG